MVYYSTEEGIRCGHLIQQLYANNNVKGFSVSLKISFLCDKKSLQGEKPRNGQFPTITSNNNHQCQRNC